MTERAAVVAEIGPDGTTFAADLAFAKADVAIVDGRQDHVLAEPEVSR